VRTLASYLTAEQKKKTRKPYLYVAAVDQIGGIPRLHWQTMYAGADAAGPHALAIPTDGSLNRLRVESNTLYRQRTVTPDYGGPDPNLGKKTVGAIPQTLPAHYKQATKFTLAADTTITTILAYAAAVTGTVSARAVIYADAAGSPAALLATSDELPGIDTTPAWREFTLPTPVDLDPGDYWLGVIVPAGTNLYYDAGSTEQTRFNIDTYADGPSDPFGAPGLSLDREYSIYATRPAFDTWTSFRAATRLCALARYGANLLAFAVDNATPTQIYKAESTDNGASWGAWALLATAAGTITHIAATSATAGDTLVIIAVGATVYRIRRTATVWGALTVWTNTAASITGLAVHHWLDFNCIITGTETTTLHPHVWSCIYGDGYSQALNTWSTLRATAEASAGAGVTFSNPSLTYADTWRAAHREAYSGAAPYDRHALLASPIAADFVDNIWTEPRPFNLDHDYGLALDYTNTHVWATTPNRVYRAPIGQTPLDLSADVLSCVAHDHPLSPQGATIRLTNHDGRYNAPGAGDLLALSRGARIDIAPGYHCPAHPAAHSHGPSYYIDTIDHVSDPTRRELVIHASSAWSLLARWRPGRTYRWPAGSRNYFQLFSAILAKMALEFSCYTSSPKLTDDFPDFAINPGYDPPPYLLHDPTNPRHSTLVDPPPVPDTLDLPAWGNGLAAITTLISHLEDRLMAREDMIYGVWPKADDTPDYALGTDHVILSATYRQRAPADRFLAYGDADLAAEVIDYATVDLLHDRPHVSHDKNMTTAASVTNRATRDAREATINSRADTVTIPVHCGLELWDVVAITDPALGLAAVNRRVTGIVLVYDTQTKPAYHQVLTLGEP